MAVQFTVVGRSALHMCLVLSIWTLSAIRHQRPDDMDLTFSASQETSDSGCSFSVEYVPSKLEVFWREYSKNLTDPTFKPGKYTGPKWPSGPQQEAACNIMREQEQEINHWLQVWEARQMSTAATFDKDIVSYQIHKSTCRSGTEVVARTVETPLEPLFGYLAHPTFKCLKGVKISRAKTEYMFPFWSKEIMPSPKETSKPIRKFFFDCGASVYDSGPASLAGNGSLYQRDEEDESLREVSQKWFMEEYAKKGIQFDRILAWEMEIHAPSSIFGRMPDDIFDRTSYYNMPVSADRNSKYSPLRTLKALVKPEDFVVFKLDIDHPETEQRITATILESGREFCDLIDEIWIEHHVWSPKMQVFEAVWEGKEANITMSLHDSFEIFAKLRECGIRSHSWI